MKFETVKINDLTPYVNNARKHSDKQIKQIQKSIKEFGFLNPVIIDATNGIIAGHGRVAAAIKLKIKEVPCIRAEHLTEVQKQAYILADNKLALNSEWDDTILQSELQALKELQFDFETIGFDELPGFTPSLPDENKSNESPEEKLVLIVTLESQEDKQLLFDELRDRGYKVKV
jgi:ParB-like chromosome segregation protein Spo0J